MSFFSDNCWFLCCSRQRAWSQAISCGVARFQACHLVCSRAACNPLLTCVSGPPDTWAGRSQVSCLTLRLPSSHCPPPAAVSHRCPRSVLGSLGSSSAVTGSGDFCVRRPHVCDSRRSFTLRAQVQAVGGPRPQVSPRRVRGHVRCLSPHPTESRNTPRPPAEGPSPASRRFP